jgi:pimeloyl-ACP methyl ester carboxylesterase
MQRVVIFIPGTMGSRLVHPGTGAPLWHEDAVDSFGKMAANPSLYKLNTNANLRPDGVLANVRFGPFTIARLNTRLRETLRRTYQPHYVEFPYDWRLHLPRVANQLGEWLTERCDFLRYPEGRQQVDEQPRLSIVAHSMGGLVTAVALMRGFLNPANVDHLVTVGTPFRGAPAAFRGLYDLGYLPGLTRIETLVNLRLNRRTCRANMREAFQSFVSSYELLPHDSDRFVALKGKGRVHPFEHEGIRRDYSDAAREVHAEMQGFPAFVDTHPNMNTLFIYANDRGETDSIYEATPAYGGFEKVQCSQKTEGDGTVEASSASLNYKARHGSPVAGVKHANMCDSQKVVDLVLQHLAQPRT